MNGEEFFKDDWSIPNVLAYCNYELNEVSDVLHYREGQNEGDNWLCVFKASDGKFVYVTAGCDYTGWGCQEDGWSVEADSLEALVPEMDTEGRMAFGYQEVPDCGV